MFFRLLMIGVLSSGLSAVDGLEEALLDSLSGEHGGNVVTVCAGGAGSVEGEGGAGTCRGVLAGPDTCRGVLAGPGTCRGVLAGPRLVLARATCLPHRPVHHLHVFPAANDFCCDDETVLHSDKIRRVTDRHIYPGYHAATSDNDFALMHLNRPFNMDSIKRTNSTYSLLEKLSPWIHRISELHQPVFMRENRRMSPQKLFLIAVLLPFLSFILFFLYVTSGTSPPNILEGRKV